MATEEAPQVMDLDGIEPAYTAADATGNYGHNDGKSFLHVKNGGVGSVDITIESQRQCDQGFTHDVVVSIPAGEERMLAPFGTRRFNDSDNYLQWSFDDVTSVTVGFFSTGG